MTTTDKPVIDPRTDAALRSLDPAEPARDARDPGAQAILARIVATDPATGPAPAPPDTSGLSRRAAGIARPRRAVLVGAVLLVAAGLVIVPAMTRSHPAYASWTAKPTVAADAEVMAAGEACRTFLSDALPAKAELPTRSAGADDGTEALRAGVAASRTVLAEQRGDWTFVVMAAPDGTEGSCLTAQRWTGVWGSGAINAGPAPALDGARDAVSRSLGFDTTSEGGFYTLTGLVGDSVTGVTITVGDLQIEATVTPGRFAAWWPSPATPQDDKSVNPIPAVTLTLTFDDGSTRHLTAEESAPMSGHGAWAR